MTIAQIKRDAYAALENRDATLQCMDFKGRVTIKHQDDSSFELSYAIAEERVFGNFKLLLVWTEHCGYFFFFTDDLDSWYYTPYEHEDTQKRPEGKGRSEERSDDY